MSKLTVSPPTLVAHRGYSGRYPENTLLAYKKAYQYGARYMELDLQLTRDLKPVLHHDQSLLRMAGVDLDIREIKAKQVKRLRAVYQEKFGTEFLQNRFTSFKKFCKWLKQKPDVTIFVELKQESIDHFGVEVFVEQVCNRIAKLGVTAQCVIISFNQQSLEYCRKISQLPIGWVLPAWTEENKNTLDRLKPEFLFCDKTRLPLKDENIWQGNWQWAVYNLDDVPSAIEMANRGISCLETNEIEALMKSEELTRRT